MPKSRRTKLVSLTQTDKKTRADKERIGDEIREAVDKYAYTWVFGVNNMRNTFLKNIRQDWAGSRILFGRTRVMQKALGRTPEEEHRDNLHKLAAVLGGDVGLLMTDETPEVVKEYFDAFVKSDFARAGVVSPVEFVVPAGIVYSTGGQAAAENDVPMAHTLEPTLRQLGMPTRLKQGKIELENEYVVCKAGETLTGRQTRLLKQFGVVAAEFKVNLLAYYDRDAETVNKLEESA
ncbi:ribosome assembly factor Mrt4p [Trichomonascus vanleenenianus]|uniref:ribosome assembly factor MRT4 n=1 Tax=Trichomonascus vanleenenianus TaxID=2268995 RepID=UPI003ECB26FB